MKAVPMYESLRQYLEKRFKLIFKTITLHRLNHKLTYYRQSYFVKVQFIDFMKSTVDRCG